MEGLVRCSANYVPLTPISFLERAAKAYGDRNSVVYGSLKYTWAQTHERCLRLASALTDLGISPGDVENILVSVFTCAATPNPTISTCAAAPNPASSTSVSMSTTSSSHPTCRSTQPVQQLLPKSAEDHSSFNTILPAFNSSLKTIPFMPSVASTPMNSSLRLSPLLLSTVVSHASKSSDSAQADSQAHYCLPLNDHTS